MYLSRLNQDSSFSLPPNEETRIVMGNPDRGSCPSPFNEFGQIVVDKAGIYEIEQSIEIIGQLNAGDYLLISAGGLNTIGYTQFNGETSILKASLAVYLDMGATAEILGRQSTSETVTALNNGRANYIRIKRCIE